jgi:ribosome-associated protein
MAEAIRVRSGIVVPAAAMQMRAVRSSGPGGQNVNKVASRVELRVDLERVTGLSGAARERLEAVAGRRKDADGLLLITSQRTRDQHRNLDDCRERVRLLIEKALKPPRVRRPTRRTRASQQRRLEGKRRQSERKRSRGRVEPPT